MSARYSFLLRLMFAWVVLSAAPTAFGQAPRNLNRYLENPTLTSENQEPTHVALMPFQSREAAVAGDWSASPYFLSLDGDWRFHFAVNPDLAPEEFYREEYDIQAWPSIRVPGTWQTQGYGRPIYRNIPMDLHPFDPPFVPDDYNETGSYVRSFTIPAGWDGRQVFLHFEGVQSAHFVWINGRYVGFDKGSMTPAEYDVTPYVREGVNRIAVRVYRWSDGSYLEDVDAWRFSGIYRSVYLFSTPKVHVQDFYVRTDLDDRYRDAVLRVDAEIKHYAPEGGGTFTLRGELLDAGGDRVSTFGERFTIEAGKEARVRLRKEVEHPRLWSDEKPNLYTLLLELVDSRGQPLEWLNEQVGFRELEIRNGQALLNGVAIEFKGVNRHEHHPEYGRTLTSDMMRRDVELMKQFNVNAVRTSHYPNDPEWYELTDRYGILVQDESNTECHYAEWGAHDELSNRKGWEAAFMDRWIRMIERDKNHPSVVMWSTGNECGLGFIHYMMAEWAREHEPTRWLYHQPNVPDGEAPYVDIIGPRYPSPAGLRAIAERDPRPVVMGEYAHAFENSLGHFDEFWDLIHEYPTLQGGFIWDWVDQGLWQEHVTTPDRAAGISATVMGRPELVEGRRGKALSLSGLDDWVEVYDDPSLDVTDSTLTLEAWVYPRPFKGSNTFIAKGRQYGLEQTSPETLAFYIHDGEPLRVEARLPDDWTDNWHHIAGVYDGRFLRLYIDREEAASVRNERAGIGATDSGHAGVITVRDGFIDRSWTPVNIGRNSLIHHEQFQGWISNAVLDDVRIYGRALAASELGQASLPAGARLALDFDGLNRSGRFLSYGSSPFLLNGVIFADRTVQPETHQMKRSHAGVRVLPKMLRNGMVQIVNGYGFTNLNELAVRWSLHADGQALQEGELQVSGAPGDTVAVRVPYTRPQPEPGVEYLLTLSFRLPHATLWAEAGHEVAFAQFILPVETPAAAVIPTGGLPPLQVNENGPEVVITGNDFAYTFSRSEGTLTSMTYRGTELLVQGPRLNVWRSPLQNERVAWGDAEAERWRALGLDRLEHRVKRTSLETRSAQEVIFEAHTLTHAPNQPVGFENTYRFRVLGSGDLFLEHDVTPFGYDMPWIQRLGVQMEVTKSLDTFTWYGRGPFETYPDRKTGARIGVYSGSVMDQYVPYVVPTDYGNKTDVRWAALINDSGIGLAVLAMPTLNVSVHPYANLDRALYAFQLRQAEGNLLNLHPKVTGVGDTPVAVRMRYRTYPEAYSYRLRLRPFDAGEVSPMQLDKQRFALEDDRTDRLR